MSTDQILFSTVVRPGTYEVDPVHSRIGFSAKHLGIGWVRGRFDSFSGTVTIPGDLTSAKVAGVIEAASVDTHFSMRDDHLRSPEFFDVENHPTISFSTTSISPLGEREFKIAGDITIRGITKAVIFEAQLEGSAVDQFGGERIGLLAIGQLNLRDFGVPYDQHVLGVPVVAASVSFELDVEAVKQA